MIPPRLLRTVPAEVYVDVAFASYSFRRRRHTREYASQGYKSATSGTKSVCGSEYRIISEFSALILALIGTEPLISERGQVGTSQRETDEARAISRFRKRHVIQGLQKARNFNAYEALNRARGRR